MAIDLNGIAEVLVNRFGLDIKVEAIGKFADLAVALYLNDLHQNESFSVQVKLGWRSIEAVSVFGTYSAEIIGLMGRAEQSQKASFGSLANQFVQSGGDLKMQVNRQEVQPHVPETWPGDWNQLQISLKRVPLMVDAEDVVQTRDQVVYWGGGLLGLLLSLLPVEEVEAESVSELVSAGMPEGAKERVEVNRYERSRLNRALCIAAHGVTCKVCGFNFENVYGEIGAGFINVHHITPVSKIGEGYLVNPVDDLVPVCPNCHAMLHRFDPPVSVEEMKKHFVGKERPS